MKAELPESPPQPLLFSLDGLSQTLDVSKRWIHQQISAGAFPGADVKLSPSMPRWTYSLVASWIAARREGSAG